MPASAVSLPAALAARLVAHARRDRPRECCGLLLGTASALLDAVPARNLEPRPTRYRVDPADHFAALRAARARGLEVVGAYHSHPDSPPRPSPTDLAEAFPGFLFLIVSLAAPDAALAAWRLEAGNFVEVTLVGTP